MLRMKLCSTLTLTQIWSNGSLTKASSSCKSNSQSSMTQWSTFQATNALVIKWHERSSFSKRRTISCLTKSGRWVMKSLAYCKRETNSVQTRQSCTRIKSLLRSSMRTIRRRARSVKLNCRSNLHRLRKKTMKKRMKISSCISLVSS